MARVLLKTPAVAPPCFGNPERCEPCAGCGVRILCYERHATREPVHLLPLDRPAPEHRAKWGSSFASPFKKPEEEQ